MAWLKAAEPERPPSVLAEPVFFKPLMPLSPSVVFFPPEAEEQLAHTPLHRVVNLSHRPEAARIAGRMKAEQKLGATLRGKRDPHPGRLAVVPRVSGAQQPA